MNFKSLLKIAVIFIILMSLVVFIGCSNPDPSGNPDPDTTPNPTPDPAPPNPTPVPIPADVEFLGTWTFLNTTQNTKEELMFFQGGLMIDFEFSPPESLNKQGDFSIQTYDTNSNHIYALFTGGDLGIAVGTPYYITYTIDTGGAHFAMSPDGYPEIPTADLYIKS